jgi:hypothetical protein
MQNRYIEKVTQEEASSTGLLVRALLMRYGTCKAAPCKWLCGGSTTALYSTELHADSQVTTGPK